VAFENSRVIKLFSRTTARVMNGIGGFGVERNDEWSPASRGRKDARDISRGQTWAAALTLRAFPQAPAARTPHVSFRRASGARDGTVRGHRAR